jgi:hypothetical protein
MPGLKPRPTSRVDSAGFISEQSHEPDLQIISFQWRTMYPDSYPDSRGPRGRAEYGCRKGSTAT